MHTNNNLGSFDSKSKILVIGYYDKSNLGDDAYKYVMHKYFPNSILNFISSDCLHSLNWQEYNAIVVGGGDLINDYFNEHISIFLENVTIPKITFGVPFPNLITPKYLSHYEYVFTRNIEDLSEIQKIVGSNKCHFIPDIVLNLTYDNITPKVEKKHVEFSILEI